MRRSSKLVLAAAVLVICGVVFGVLTLLNRGPDLPSISYVPEGKLKNLPWMVPGEAGQGGENGVIGPLPPLAPGTAVGISDSMTPEEKTAAIQRKYMAYFNYLRDVYREELDHLIASAKADYRDVKSGKKHTPLARLAVEYGKAGESLEKDCDMAFSRVLGAMGAELNANNLPDDLVRQAQSEYDRQKEEARQEIMRQVAEARKND
ncbi:MAG: hypothetical protein ACOY31_04040 [Bacillota bacterium]